MILLLAEGVVAREVHEERDSDVEADIWSDIFDDKS